MCLLPWIMVYGGFILKQFDDCPGEEFWNIRQNYLTGKYNSELSIQIFDIIF